MNTSQEIRLGKGGRGTMIHSNTTTYRQIRIDNETKFLFPLTSSLSSPSYLSSSLPPLPSLLLPPPSPPSFLLLPPTSPLSPPPPCPPPPCIQFILWATVVGRCHWRTESTTPSKCGILSCSTFQCIWADLRKGPTLRKRQNLTVFNLS